MRKRKCQFCEDGFICSNPRFAKKKFLFIEQIIKCVEKDPLTICLNAIRLPKQKPPPHKPQKVDNGLKVNGMTLTNHARLRLWERFGLNKIPIMDMAKVGETKGGDLYKMEWVKPIYLVVSKDCHIVSVWNNKIVGTMWDSIKKIATS